MRKSHILVLIIWYGVFTGSRVSGQAINTDSIQLHRVAVNMVNNLNKAVGQQSRLYNGPINEPYNFRSSTNAYFKDTTSYTNGSVNYDDIIYNDVPLIYDLYKDIVASVLYNGFSTYDLLSERVTEFYLFGHHFIRLIPDSLNKQMDVGFYDELYHNHLQLLIRRTKSIQQEISATDIKSVFVPKNYYFLKKKGLYYRVNSRGKFFDVLKDKKTELKKYLKDNKVNFKGNPEEVMTMLCKYYDHLTN